MGSVRAGIAGKKGSGKVKGLYDIHCHLIPGVDDGSQTMEESLEALRLEYEEGVRHIICTPHFSAGSEQGYANRVKDSFEQLKSRLRDTSYGSEMKLYLGNELMYTESLLDCLDAGQAYTMAGGHYVLVEFLPSVRYEELYRGLRKLSSAGYVPILAHMERYQCLIKNEERLDELRDLGICLQVNGASLFGGLFHSAAAGVRRLCREGRIHFLGTDSHGTHYRKPQLKKAAEWVADNCPDRVIERMLRGNPLAVLEDKIL